MENVNNINSCSTLIELLSIVEIQIVYKQSISRNNAKKIHKNENRTALLVLLLFENNRT